MNKKGTIMEISATLIILFFIAICVIIGYQLKNQINDQLMKSFPDGQAHDLTQQFNETTSPGFYQNIFLSIFATIFLTTIITSFFVNTHPIFFVISLITWVIQMVLAPIMSNAYEGLLSNSLFADTPTIMPLLNYVMLYLPIIVLVEGAFIMVVMYAVNKINQ